MLIISLINTFYVHLLLSVTRSATIFLLPNLLMDYLFFQSVPQPLDIMPKRFTNKGFFLVNCSVHWLRSLCDDKGFLFHFFLIWRLCKHVLLHIYDNICSSRLSRPFFAERRWSEVILGHISDIVFTSCCIRNVRFSLFLWNSIQLYLWHLRSFF